MLCLFHAPVCLFKPLLPLACPFFIFLLCVFLCQAGYVNGNPSGSRSGNRSKRPSWRSGSSSAVTPLTDRTLWISLCSTAQTTLIAYLKHPDHRDRSILFLWNRRSWMRPIFWERIEAPLPPLRPRPKCNVIHPRQLSPYPRRLELPFSNDEILCGYGDIVSSGTDHFAAWVKVSPHEVLVQHVVDIQKATADFREASERKPATSSHTNSVNKHLATRSIVQKRLSIYNWNPGPDVEKKPSKSKLQEDGISLPCRRRPNMLIITFLQVGST